MAQYVCSVCGYVYDDEKEGVPFASLPDSWTCPMCGAPKAMFEKKGGEVKETVKEDLDACACGPRAEAKEDLHELSALELSIMFSSLAKGSEKQYMAHEKELFTEIADYYKMKSPAPEDASIESFEKHLNEDLKEGYAKAVQAAKSDADRGALRALTWSEKVSKIVSSLIDRYEKEGISFLKDNKIFVCEICGYVHIGPEAPDICPICKVPKFKFHEVKR